MDECEVEDHELEDATVFPVRAAAPAWWPPPPLVLVGVRASPLWLVEASEALRLEALEVLDVVVAAEVASPFEDALRRSAQEAAAAAVAVAVAIVVAVVVDAKVVARLLLHLLQAAVEVARVEVVVEVVADAEVLPPQNDPEAVVVVATASAAAAAATVLAVLLEDQALFRETTQVAFCLPVKKVFAVAEAAVVAADQAVAAARPRTAVDL